MMTLIKCFSVLIASGKGHRCIELRSIIHEKLLVLDESTGKMKATIFKYGKRSNPKDFRRVSTELTQCVTPLYQDVNDHFFGEDSALASDPVEHFPN